MALKKIKFMDTSFRDGFQSVYGARVITKDFIPAFEASIEAGITHFEFGGGARFQSLYFYTQEDAFDMMDTLRGIAGPDINLQTLSRGINVVGLSQCPRDIINLHAVLFKKHGTTTIRNFDALNDIQNLDYSGRCITNAGLKHEITISLMGLPPGINDTTVHTPEFYIEKLEEILKRDIPFNSLVFKDATGTTPPRVVKETIKRTREILGKDATIWFHTHDTAGLGTACILAACEAGVDGVDLSKSPVSGGTCQPDILTVWAAFRHTEFTLDIDYQKVLKAERVFEDCMQHYLVPPEAKETTPMIVLAPMPGGALTANTMMMRDTNTLHLYPKVIEEMAEVVARGGFGTSVTPVSQFYIQQAYMNAVMGKWKKITEGYGNMVLGYFGKTPRPADPEIVKIASEQLKKEPFTATDPLDIIEPGIEKARKILLDNKLPDTDENIFIIATCETKGLEFLKGNAPLAVYYKKEDKKEEVKPASPPTQAPTKPTLPQSMVVNVNGKDYNVSVRESGTAKIETAPPKTEMTSHKVEPPKAEAPKPVAAGSKTIKAPMAGVVLRLLVRAGDKVKVDQPVAVLEAMKMENEIYSDENGTIAQIMVREGESVEEGRALIEVRS